MTLHDDTIISLLSGLCLKLMREVKRRLRGLEF